MTDLGQRYVIYVVWEGGREELFAYTDAPAYTTRMAFGLRGVVSVKVIDRRNEC